ncbi:Gfo/Idh/MocA family protein [Roseomonas sp. 18066]|uniref:Gfo/Idh/MocA family protein n=1 Tax=Roseomonas sp. 18066 TaxID=2681412 RepID=UPI001F31B9E6|nr:Gfo/Idh/MocA family oxidoreductase [Roseomonas sp. 18066]
MGGALTGLLLGGPAAGQTGYSPPTEVDIGRVTDGKVEFPNWRAAADPSTPPPPAPLPPAQRVGFAIVGLGRLSLEELLPAFAECGFARPAALVSGTPDKLQAVAKQYGIPEASCYDYASFDRLRDNPDVRVVYVVLPNGMHREYVERAAAAGKHVLCEKPLANSAEEARDMIAACERAAVKLMVAYRIQYQPHNLAALRIIRSGDFGRLVGMTAVNVQTVAANGTQQWRHKKAMAGGGALPDIGLYCLNTARFLSGEEPVQVHASLFSPAGDARYAEVEETVSFTLRFPSGFIANCFTSYGARDDKYQRLNLAAATIDMPNAYKYQGQELYLARNLDGQDQRGAIILPPKNQFAAEIDHMAQCVLQGSRPRTPGEEGLQDHMVMEAIYSSAASGQPVALPPQPRRDMFRSLPDGIL